MFCATSTPTLQVTASGFAATSATRRHGIATGRCAGPPPRAGQRQRKSLSRNNSIADASNPCQSTFQSQHPFVATPSIHSASQSQQGMPSEMASGYKGRQRHLHGCCRCQQCTCIAAAAAKGSHRTCGDEASTAILNQCLCCVACRYRWGQQRCL